MDLMDEAALGFSIGGIGFSYALSPLSSHLISNFGWQTAYQILGSVISWGRIHI